MGCPQGSVLGPMLWNILLDDLLRLPIPEGCKLIAYADDVTVVIEANSRAEIESKATTVMSMVTDWGERNRLSFAPNKTCTMTIKGSFKRAPIIKLRGSSVSAVPHTMVLGVTLESSLSFARHARSMGERACKCFGKVSRVSTTSWGLQYKVLRHIYKGTYVPTITYAAAVWFHRAKLHVVRSLLLRTQRPALILLTKAYRSTSSAALPVLAGVLPADLEVIRAGKISEGREGKADREIGALAQAAQEEAESTWRGRWIAETKGRDLFSFFPDAVERLRMGHVEPNYQVSQILTGHGCFRKRLYDMKLTDISTCTCGASEETRDHVLWECPLYIEERERMQDAVRGNIHGPIGYADLVSSRANFVALKRFAHSWHAKRAQEEDRRS